MDSHYQRFLFDDLDIRGACVRLGGAWRAMLDGRDYAPVVAELLGQLTAVSTLLAGERKQPGRLTFQLRSQGPITLLVIDCDEQLRLRGMAKTTNAPLPDAAGAEALLGDGQLVMTLELPEATQPFQSIVPIEGDDIGAIFENFLRQSQQQPARILVAADPLHASALFLQKLPDADRRDADGWTRLLHLAATISPSDLLTLDIEPLLSRVFAEETVRVYPPRPVCYHCPRDPARVQSTLRGLGRQELDAILAEHGEVVVHDDIGNHDYRFDAAQIAGLFAAPADDARPPATAVPPPDPTLH